MVSRCETAIDLAGYELVHPLVSVPLPSTSELQGVLRGDLQSLDSQGSLYCYYVRPSELKVLPTWLANLAELCHAIPDTKFYIVVPESNPGFERSCRVAGAGLLLLPDDNVFKHVLNFDSLVPDVREEMFAAQIRALRSELMSKRDLKVAELQKRFERIGDLTAGMSENLASSYRRGVERLHRQWSEWGDDIGVELDRVLAERDVARLPGLREAIESGPLLDEDV